MRKKKKVGAEKGTPFYIHIFLLVFLCLSLFPIALLALNSLKTNQEVLGNPMSLPAVPQWQNYADVWQQGGYSTAFMNSMIAMVVSIAVVVTACGCCAYAMTKLKPRGSRLVSNYFMFTMSVSVTLCLIPLFFIWMKLRLMNTLHGLILIYIGINIPLIVTIMRSFFLGIPDEILESARIDGCGEWSILWKIVVPVSKPIFLTSSLLVGLAVWNEFFYANSFIQTDSLRTVATRYLAFTGQYSSDWSKICTAGVITILPMVILYLIFQRQFIEGLTAGSVKG
ncbi:MAG: carbohydrate ABC transporter permease [Lachnospiraceae bacterium]|nr:carbohydrate ABC transporter permease [Lachnospiraceae bacterium]